MSNHSRTLDYAYTNGLETVETTSQSNGYPANLRHVLIFDTITDALNHEETLQKQGHEVTELMIHKRDGWQLWYRYETSIMHGMMQRSTDSEWTIDIDNKYTPDGSQQEELDEEFASIAATLEDGQTVTVFYDPDNRTVDYWADRETVGYSHDTHTYQVALMVDWKDDSEE